VNGFRATSQGLSIEALETLKLSAGQPAPEALAIAAHAQVYATLAVAAAIREHGNAAEAIDSLTAAVRDIPHGR
jgi:hypothetical protein